MREEISGRQPCSWSLATAAWHSASVPAARRQFASSKRRYRPVHACRWIRHPRWSHSSVHSWMPPSVLAVQGKVNKGTFIKTDARGVGVHSLT